MARALLRRRRIFAAATEDTVGTAESLAAGDGAFVAFGDRNLTPNIQMDDRMAQDSFSRHASVPGARQGSLTVQTHLVGAGASGSTPLWYDTLLLASGFADSSNTANLDSSSDTALTVGMYEDGRLSRLSGSKVDWTWTFVPGQIVTAEWNITGKYIEPTSVALISPTFPTVQPPRFVAATLTIGGTPWAKVGQCQIAMNNQIELREDASADDDPTRSNDGTGYHAAVIVDRNIQITIDPESTVFGTKNWYQDLMDADEAAFQLVLGSDAGNTITIDAPKVQVVSAQPGDRNGVMVDQLTLQCNRDSAADDELTVALS